MPSADMEKYVVGSKILKKEHVLISIVIAILLLAPSLPVRASSPPKAVVSGLPSGGLATLASDSLGNLYYAVYPNYPTQTTVNLYRLAAGSNTPKLIFTESDPTASLIYLGYLSFDLLGNVYFLAADVGQTNAAGSTVITASAYRLNDLNHFSPTLLYSQTGTTGYFCGYFSGYGCMVSGTLLLELATDAWGNVAIAAATYCPTCVQAGGELVYVPVLKGTPSVRASLDDVGLDQQTMAMNNRGDVFLDAFTGTAFPASGFEVMEVTPSGGIVYLVTNLPSFTSVATDPLGNLFILTRSYVGFVCDGETTSTTIMFEEFTWQSLLHPNPVGVQVSQVTYPEYIWMVQGEGSDQFRVSITDTVYYTLYPSTAEPETCGFTTANVNLLSVRLGAPQPTVVASGVNDFYTMGLFIGGLYYGSINYGTIYLVRT